MNKRMPKYLKRGARVVLGFTEGISPTTSGTVTKVDGNIVWVKFDDGGRFRYHYTYLRKPKRPSEHTAESDALNDNQMDD
jgi:hypothetical protein